eukprot:m.32051 g.32051  ORF g.32051 m.32051 type:complete len:318 (+) comp12118_c0_seq1:75-1028(+)
MAWRPRFEVRVLDGVNVSPSKLRQQLAEDGFVILRGFLDPGIVADTRAACESLQSQTLANLKEAGTIDEDGEGLSFECKLAHCCKNCIAQVPSLYRSELHVPELFDLFFGRDISDLMMSLIGCDELRLFPNYTARPKLPNSNRHTVAWHQDAALSGSGQPNEAEVDVLLRNFGFDGSYFRTLNCWTSLVPVTAESGCMRFIPGSHKNGILKHVCTGYVEGDTELFTTQIQPELMEDLVESAIDVCTQPGDLVIFSNMLIHGAYPNRKEGFVRWSLDWRYQDGELDTLRPEQGHVVRSLLDMDREVQSPEEWEAASLQ